MIFEITTSMLQPKERGTRLLIVDGTRGTPGSDQQPCPPIWNNNAVGKGSDQTTKPINGMVIEVTEANFSVGRRPARSAASRTRRGRIKLTIVPISEARNINGVICILPSRGNGLKSERGSNITKTPTFSDIANGGSLSGCKRRIMNGVSQHT
jgi:hypothetical protein